MKHAKSTYDDATRVPPDPDRDPLRLHAKRSGAIEEGRHMMLALPGRWSNSPVWQGQRAPGGWAPRVVRRWGDISVSRFGREYAASIESDDLLAPTMFGRTPGSAVARAIAGIDARTKDAKQRLAERMKALDDKRTALVALQRAVNSRTKRPLP